MNYFKTLIHIDTGRWSKFCGARTRLSVCFAIFSLVVCSKLIVNIMMMFRIILLVGVIASCLFASSQTVNTLSYPCVISGTVFDENGKPLPGANVNIPGTPNGIISDLEGNYILQIPNEHTPVFFSYLGYETVIYCPDNRIKVDIVLSTKTKWIKKMTWRIRYLFKSKKYLNPCLTKEGN